MIPIPHVVFDPATVYSHSLLIEALRLLESAFGAAGRPNRLVILIYLTDYYLSWILSNTLPYDKSTNGGE